jgi:hypothetical protein
VEESKSSLIYTLKRSRTRALGVEVYSSPVVDVVREIEAIAAQYGLIVGRWISANKEGGRTTIRWAVFTGERTKRFTDMPPERLIAFVVLSRLEYANENCEAFIELHALLNNVKNYVRTNQIEPTATGTDRLTESASQSACSI